MDIHWIFRGAVFGGRWSFIRFFTGYVVFFTGAGLPALERRKHWSFMGMCQVFTASLLDSWRFASEERAGSELGATVGAVLLRCFLAARRFSARRHAPFLARQREAHVLAPGLGSRLCGGSVGKGRRLLNILRGRGGHARPVLCFAMVKLQAR